MDMVSSNARVVVIESTRKGHGLDTGWLGEANTKSGVEWIESGSTK